MKTFCVVSFLVLQILCFSLKAQTCSPCTFTVHNTDSASYTVNTGQILCIDSTAKFSGTIVLNGGTVCNKGVMKPKSFTYNSGTINNYNNIQFPSGVVLNSGQSIINHKKSLVKSTNALTISGGSLTNHGIMNIVAPLTFTSGVLNNTGILNCKAFNGNSASVTNTGIINKN